ncbi:MAG: transposase [Cypionkella sp.]|nr:transposase [Cypionkella sp.]
MSGVATADIPSYAAKVAAQGGCVVFEATGGLEAPLRRALAEAGVTAYRVNPARARAFARSTGRLAKTDRVDAAVLREMGLRLDLSICAPEPEDLCEIRQLRVRRRQLVQDRTREVVRAGQAEGAYARASIARVLALLDAEITAVESEIAAKIKASPWARARVDLLRSAPGVGPVVATALLTELPEIGQIDGSAAAALAGLAPMARDSGLRSGPRRIGGGRKPLRDALYLAALSAMRHCPQIRDFAARLKANGKSGKQCVIACARKLLTILNAMVKQNRAFQPT